MRKATRHWRSLESVAERWEKQMIFLTGDFHGGIDGSKLNTKSFPEGRTLSKDDFVIILGDFGLPWCEPGQRGYKQEQWWLNWLNQRPWTTLFVKGNHENYDKLAALPVVEAVRSQKIRARKLSDSIYALENGFQRIDGHGLFIFGGATSIDIAHRTEGVSWWKEEVPSKEEMHTALESAAGQKVDYILTRTTYVAAKQHLLAGTGNAKLDQVCAVSTISIALKRVCPISTGTAATSTGIKTPMSA
jgi:hypothetical protein